MKKFLLFAAFIAATTFAQAQPPKGVAKVGSTYGAKITPDGATDASQLPSLIKSDDSKTPVKVKGKITDVCSKKGCWVKLQINDHETAFVKMKDYGFFLPTSAIGKTVVIDGEAYMETTSVEELRHYAEDAKKPQSEIDAITEPGKQIRVTATGIRVVAGS